VCLAAFCDWDKNENAPADIDAFEELGKNLADLVLVYQGGTEKRLPLRRRFEVSAPSIWWGHFPYSCLACRETLSTELNSPLQGAEDWGRLQMSITLNSTRGPWISALENPDPERQLAAIRLEAIDEDPLIVCGVTLFHGKASPLRRERLSLYRFTLPEARAEDRERWRVTVDLGVVPRTYALSEFNA
jgi:hypothetical protein